MPHKHRGWRNRTRRLPLAAYAQLGSVCSLTIAVRDRRPVFADADLAAAAVEVLRSHAAKQAVPVYGYCVMPDHVHLVLGPSPRCDVVTFVGQFKNLVLRVAWERGLQGSFWQTSFWDHFVRAEEGLRAAVAYVLANPVRRGLAKDWRDYPFAGWLEGEGGVAGDEHGSEAEAAGDKPPRYGFASAVCQVPGCEEEP